MPAYTLSNPLHRWATSQTAHHLMVTLNTAQMDWLSSPVSESVNQVEQCRGSAFEKPRDNTWSPSMEGVCGV